MSRLSFRFERVALAVSLVALVAACSRDPGGARLTSTAGSGEGSTAAGGDQVPTNAEVDAAASGGTGVGGQSGTDTATQRRAGPAGQASGGSSQGAGVARGSSVGVTKDTITISVSLPVTSAYGALAEKAYQYGVLIWQQEVNANGGIHGRKIAIKKVDNQNTAEGAVAACKEQKSNGSFASLGLISQPQEDECLSAAGIPVMNRAAADYKPSWQYAIPETRPAAFAPTYVSFLKSSHMKAGGKKIGIVFTGDMSQTAASSAAIAAELRKQGLQLVHTEKVTTGQASFVSEMSRMRAAGAELVIMALVVESPGVLRDAKAIGYNPQWLTDIHGAALDSICQAAGPNCNGMFGVRLWLTTNDPAYASYVQKVRKYQGDSAARAADTSDAGIYSSADHFGKLLELAGPNITRESFLAAARAMDPYDNKLTGSFSFKDRSEGIHALFPIQCCNPDGTFRALGPAREQF